MPGCTVEHSHYLWFRLLAAQRFLRETNLHWKERGVSGQTSTSRGKSIDTKYLCKLHIYISVWRKSDDLDSLVCLALAMLRLEWGLYGKRVKQAWEIIGKQHISPCLTMVTIILPVFGIEINKGRLRCTRYDIVQSQDEISQVLIEAVDHHISAPELWDFHSTLHALAGLIFKWPI